MTLLPHVQPQSVTEITHEIKELIEVNLDSVCVCGEVSNCKAASSGHVYLTLKDETAQLAAVMWRTTASRLPFRLQDGMQVVAMGAIEVYAARGSYQLIINRLFPQGVGSLELALRQLKEKLAAEGLFEAERKRPIPRLPNRIALITSPQGAAVRDMLQVITRRWPSANIVIVPVAVQGANAAPEIAAALMYVHQIPGVDVVICGRGGGSLEDLWAFNEEVVARAIAACRVPVISAVGHEIDITIADLVADVRALTPSEAGELVVPNRADVLAALDSVRDRLVGGLKQRAIKARLRLDALASRPVLKNPGQRIRQLAEHLDDLDDRLRRSMHQRLEHSKQQLAALTQSLDALSPLGVLSRGYSVTFRTTGSPVDGDRENALTTRTLVRRATELQPGDQLLTYLDHGRVVSRVEQIDDSDLRATQ